MNTTTVNPKSRLHRMPLEPALVDREAAEETPLETVLGRLPPGLIREIRLQFGVILVEDARLSPGGLGLAAVCGVKSQLPSQAAHCWTAHAPQRVTLPTPSASSPSFFRSRQMLVFA
jgi:hypothetical protein